MQWHRKCMQPCQTIGNYANNRLVEKQNSITNARGAINFIADLFPEAITG